jgi:hypothetical protein
MAMMFADHCRWQQLIMIILHDDTGLAEQSDKTKLTAQAWMDQIGSFYIKSSVLVNSAGEPS